MAEGVQVTERRAASPQSVTRVIRLLEALCASSEPVSLADLSRRLATPKSSLAALLRGLADEGFVIGSDAMWRLGPGAFGLGSALTEARRRLQSSDLIRDGMRRLSTASGETVLLAVGDTQGESMTYVDLVESAHVVRYLVAIGDRRPFYATAGGRALLATCSAEAVESYLKRLNAQRLAPTTLVDRAGLRAAIEAAREQGYAQTVDQAAEGVTGTAAVIRDAAGQVLGALVIAAPTARAGDRLAELARLVVAEAALISRSLGFR
ncbi:IclR family transcriptional regulator [Sphingomonas sp. IC081]|uniref:IclR family transcriptional regulator n=1 Tax=Sphingomonas sp. IC081 TaxID=304378 RepID=UPI0011580393|nr:IclR family transcriptional regulator [Sphingomonas sp. IC081]QDK31796.1 IclR family transcriptional regulator [Sphingomonas sp. IC081]